MKSAAKILWHLGNWFDKDKILSEFVAHGVIGTEYILLNRFF